MANYRFLPLERVFSSTNSIVPSDRLEHQGKLSHLRNPFSSRQQSSSPEKSPNTFHNRGEGHQLVPEHQKKLEQAHFLWDNRLNGETESCPVSARNSARKDLERADSSVLQKKSRPSSASVNSANVKMIKFDSISHSWVEGYRKASEENPNSVRKYLEHRSLNPTFDSTKTYAKPEKEAAKKLAKKVEFANQDMGTSAQQNIRNADWQVFRAVRAPTFTIPPTRYSWVMMNRYQHVT